MFLTPTYTSKLKSTNGEFIFFVRIQDRQNTVGILLQYLGLKKLYPLFIITN